MYWVNLVLGVIGMILSLVSVVESTSIVSYIMVYIPTFILCACLFVCLQEM
jgi:hypothetical protein